jgi:hypothetical protein
LPGFRHSQDLFREAISSGRRPLGMDRRADGRALPTLYHGYRSSAIATASIQKAFYLMQKYAVTNTFLFPGSR